MGSQLIVERTCGPVAIHALIQLWLCFEHRAELLGHAVDLGRFVIVSFGNDLRLEALELGQERGHR